MPSQLLTFLQKDPSFAPRRLPSLYSEFNPVTNPDGYHANVSTWRKALSSAALAGVLPSQSRTTIELNSDLQRELETREWGRPGSLGTVVGESVREGVWLREGEFRGREQSVYKGLGWRIPGPIEVVGWGLRMVGVLGSSVPNVKGRLVILENLESISQDINEKIERSPKGRTERIFTKQEFRQLCGEGVSDLDTELLLLFLNRDRGVLCYDLEGGGTVKFKEKGERVPGRVTQEDKTIASLKSLIKDLEIQTSQLSTRIDDLSHTAKESVARKNRTAALAALKSKKLAESTLERRHAVLAQLEEVFNKIEQAADQVELVRVMEGSANVLKGLNKEVGGVERVDMVVDRLREQMGVVEEVGGIISELGQGTVDEGEVDDELEAMEAEETRKREEAERKVREEKERVEVEETRRRLEELEKVERDTRAKAEAEEANAKKEAEDKSIEDILTKSTEEMKKLSLQQEEAKLPVS